MNSAVRGRGSSIVGQFVGGGSHYQVQQWRGIRVRVINGDLDQAVKILQRKMQSSGIERLIKSEVPHHLKNSEKRVLARKSLEARLRALEIARKMKTILIQKVRGQS